MGPPMPVIEATRKVAVVPHRMRDQPWGTRFREELQAALVDHPEIVLELSDPEGDPVLQAHLVEKYLRQPVDALIVAPLDPELIRGALQRCGTPGVPVIAVDTDLEAPELYRALILSDNRQLGRRMGEFFVEVTGGAADLVELRGVPTTTPAIERSEGFREAIAGTGVRVVQSLVGNWLYSLAHQELARLLPGLPRLDGVFAQNDEMARGALDAASEAGRTDELLVTGVDALKGERGLQLVMEGKLAATLLNPVPGRQAAAALLAALEGRECAPRTVLQTSLFRSPERIRAWREHRKGRIG